MAFLRSNKPLNKQIAPSEGTNTNYVVFLLKYLLAGPKPRFENTYNNFIKNNEEDENIPEDPNTHSLNHFSKLFGDDEENNNEIVYVVRHPYNTHGWGQWTHDNASTSNATKNPYAASKLTSKKDTNTFDLDYDPMEDFKICKSISLSLNYWKFLESGIKLKTV